MACNGKSSGKKTTSSAKKSAPNKSYARQSGSTIINSAFGKPKISFSGRK